MTIRRPRFESFHRQQGLLFQLILSDFLASFEKIFALGDLHKKLENMGRDGCSKSKFQQTIQALQSHAVALSGKTKPTTPFHSWNFANGSLTSLKNHCAFFSLCKDQTPSEFVLLQTKVNGAWLSCIQAHDLGEVLLQIPHDMIWNSEEFASLMRNLERIVVQMGRFSRLITRLFSHFKDDENVLYFLMRHHTHFDTLYGEQYVTKLLGKLFDKGAHDAEKLLLRRYKKRGFEPHVDKIKEHFDAIA